MADLFPEATCVHIELDQGLALQVVVLGLGVVTLWKGLWLVEKDHLGLRGGCLFGSEQCRVNLGFSLSYTFVIINLHFIFVISIMGHIYCWSFLYFFILQVELKVSIVGDRCCVKLPSTNLRKW